MPTAPTITSLNHATFTVGTPGTFTATASGDATISFSKTGTLPTGVTFTGATGVLAGTPAALQGGTYPITITATNGVNPDATQAFTLTINQAPAITSANSATFPEHTADTFTVTATGFPAPTFSKTGSLPSGVTLDATTGVIAGTPPDSSARAYVLTLTATNSVGSDATQAFTLTVSTGGNTLSANAVRSLTGALCDIDAAREIAAAILVDGTLSSHAVRVMGIAFTDRDVAAEIASAITTNATLSAKAVRVLTETLKSSDIANEIATAIKGG